MRNLVMGENAPLSNERFGMVVEWPASAGALDASVYLLDASGKTRGDADMIFYNQRADADRSVVVEAMESGRTAFAIDLGKVPRDIERIVMCATVEDTDRTMAAFDGATATVVVEGGTMLSFRPILAGATEAAMRLVEVYRRNGSWKFRADGQGFNDGLAPLARSFGIDVADEDAGPSRPTAPAAGTSMPPLDPIFDQGITVGSSVKPLDDGAVILSEGRPIASWTDTASSGFRDIAVRLNWNCRCGGLHGRPRAIDLGLGCFYELQDGRTGVIQRLDDIGQLEAPPYVQLVDADGGSEQDLRINGARWPMIRRLTLFAYIASGAPNWRTAKISLDVSAPGQTPIVITIDEGADGTGVVGLLSLRNRTGGIDFERMARFFLDHRDLDTEVGMRLQWQSR